MAQNQDLTIDSFRGGQNDTDSPIAIQKDQVVLAENVEFFYSQLGERRNGCGPLMSAGELISSDLDDESVIVHLSQWHPTNDILVPEFIALGATPGVSVTLAKRTAGTWSEITAITDAFVTSNPDIYGVTTQELNGKLFVAYRSAVDRLHVWDGTTLRRTGLTQPAAPAVADEGVGAYATARYFRVRYAVLSGTTVLYRSEPSTVTTFTPSGVGAGARITKPATISEGETHWEIEASTDNANFYRIQRLVVGTTTYDDTTVFATGYSGNTLADAIGAYLLQASAKFLTVDGDRLILGGHWTDKSKQSQVAWSAVANDPGAGNDERQPIVTTGALNISTSTDLDNYEGGPLTGIMSADYGVWYGFKWDHIYRMVRTGDATRAYDVLTLSKSRGAIPGSIVKGVDERGASCIYFLDPTQGPSRVGPAGLQTIYGLRGTWGRVNLQAGSVVACGCYYPYKKQIHWWIAVDGADRPTLELCLQVDALTAVTDDAVGGGWSTGTGRKAQAVCATTFTEVVSINGVSSLSQRPFIGLTAPDYIQRCDVEQTDAGQSYVATIRSKPFLVSGLLNRWGAMMATILATANASATVVVKMIRDMGLETNSKSVSLAPAASETFVVKDLDDLVMSDATMIQIEISDA